MPPAQQGTLSPLSTSRLMRVNLPPPYGSVTLLSFTTRPQAGPGKKVPSPRSHDTSPHVNARMASGITRGRIWRCCGWSRAPSFMFICITIYMHHMNYTQHYHSNVWLIRRQRRQRSVRSATHFTGEIFLRLTGADWLAEAGAGWLAGCLAAWLPGCLPACLPACRACTYLTRLG
jgi:hypothetical protein